MKKVLAWVLALALVLSSFAMSFAAYTDDGAIAKDNATTAVRVLSALKVIEGYPDGSFKPDKEVSRAEMAALVIRAMGYDSNKGNYETKYKDVAKGDWCSGIVKYATDLGIVEGFPDGTFRPSEPVTYFQAITMILRSLGYRDEYLIGSWPSNFVNQAEEIGTYNKWFNVSTENFAKNATRADCAIMIYNTLTTCMVAYDKVDKGVLTYPDNYLKRLGGLEIESGTIEMDDIMNADESVLGMEDLGAPYDYGFIVGGDLVDVILDGDYQLVTKDEFADYTKKFGKGYNPYYFENGYVVDPTKMSVDAFTFDYAYVAIDGNYITDVWSYVSWDANETKQWTKNDALIYSQDLAITDKVQNSINVKAPYQFKADSSDADAGYYFLEGAESMDAIAEGSIVTAYVGNENYIANYTDEDGIVRDYRIGDVVSIDNKTYEYKVGLYYNGKEIFYDIAEDQKGWKYAAENANKGHDAVFNDENAWKGYFFNPYAYSLKLKLVEDADKTEYAVLAVWAPIISLVNVSTKTVEGTIEDFVAKDGTVVIDGKEYQAVCDAIAGDYTDNFGLLPQYNWMNYKCDNFLFAAMLGLKGQTGTAYLNGEGQIALWECGVKDKYYGVYEDAQAVNEGNYATGIKWGYKYKIHQANDEEDWIELNEDMTKSDIISGVFAYEMGLLVKPVDQLVQYQINDEGEIVKANFVANTLLAPAKMGVNGKLNGIVVDEDVVVFAKESSDANADYDVYGYEDLDGVTFAKGTEYFVENGMIVAIKADSYIIDNTKEIVIVKSVRSFTDHYEFTLFDGTVINTVDKKIDLRLVNDQYTFAYVEYTTDGEQIKNITKVASTGADVVGTKLAPGQVSDELINFGGIVENAGIVYIKDALGVKRPVTDATVLQWTGSKLVESDLDQIKLGTAIRLIRTVSEGEVWDYVVFSKNQTVKYYPTLF